MLFRSLLANDAASGYDRLSAWYPWVLSASVLALVALVVEMSSVFLRESDYKVVNLCHLWDETCQLDFLIHLEVSLVGLL